MVSWHSETATTETGRMLFILTTSSLHNGNRNERRTSIEDSGAAFEGPTEKGDGLDCHDDQRRPVCPCLSHMLGCVRRVLENETKVAGPRSSSVTRQQRSGGQ